MLFVHIKKFQKKKLFVYKFKLQWITSVKDKVHVYIYIHKGWNCRKIVNKKSRHFAKSKKICFTFLYTISQTLYSAQFFLKSLKLAFVYKKDDTLCYMTFLYTKIQPLRKKQDNLRYIFVYKKPDTLRCMIFHGTFEIGRGVGGAFLYSKNNAHCVTFSYLKKIHLVLRFCI